MANRTFGASYYAIITGPVLDCREISASAKLLYASITSMTEQTGYCWASNRALAERFGWGERTVSRLVAELERHGFIRYGMYTNEETHKMERRIFIGNEAAEGVAKIGEGRQNWRGGVAKNGETTQYRKEKEKKNKGSSVPVEVLDAIAAYIGDDPEYSAAFGGFLENRAALKKPVLTARAMNAIINRLRRANHRETEIAMLDKATENNWLTVYPLKPDEMPQQEQRPTAGDEEGVDGL